MATNALNSFASYDLNFDTTFLDGKGTQRSCIERISDCVNDLANQVSEAVQASFRVLGYIRSDAFNFGRVLRLCSFSFKAIELVFKPNIFNGIIERFLQTDDFIDTVNVLETVQYFSLANYADDEWATLFGNISLGAAAISGCMLFGNEMNWLDLGDFALGLGQFATAAVGAAYACFGVAAVFRLCAADTEFERKQAILDIAWCTAEIFHKIVVLAVGSVLEPIAIALGLLAAGFGLIAFSYRRLCGEVPLVDKTPSAILKPY